MTQKKLTSPAPPRVVPEPEPDPIEIMTLDQILSDLSGFGIEDTEETISIQSKGRTLHLRLANIPTEEELDTLLSTEEYKGHAWIARVKVEVLARSVSWLNGTPVLNKHTEYVLDPITQKEVTFFTALRTMMMGWGQEVINVLWKILMVHCQKIEDRLFESLPESAVMTEVEKRFLSQALQEIEEAQRETYKEAAKEMLSTSDVTE